MLGQLTRERRLIAEDVRAVLSAGVSRQQIEDALAVCFAFNTTDRLADAFGFEVLSLKSYEAGRSICSSAVTNSRCRPLRADSRD